jgi:hypothetical protein
MTLFLLAFYMILNEQAENTSLKNQLEASNGEKELLRVQLQAALGTALQPSSAGVDDEDDEMDMEEGGGGSSSVPVAFRFPSNGDTFVNRMGANDTEARLFTANQKKEMEQYIQSLTRPPTASSSGAAGGSASGLRTTSEQRDHLIKEYKELKAKYAALKRKVEHCADMDKMAVSACVCIH